MSDFLADAAVKSPAAQAGTWIQSLVWGDPTYLWAARAVMLQLLKLACPRACTLQQEKPPQ